MEATIRIGTVLTCSVTNCTYNEERRWTANDITVGDEHPTCDTYTTGPAQGIGIKPAVGTCRVAGCSFNEAGAHCMAAGVTVGDHDAHADCVTYRPE